MVADPYGGRRVLVNLVRKVGREQCRVGLSDYKVSAMEIAVVEENLSVQVILARFGPCVVPDARPVQGQGKHGDPDVAGVVNRG